MQRRAKVANLVPVHSKQVLTYLRLLNLPLGLLINFGTSTFKEGCKRIVRNHKDFASSRLRVNQNPETNRNLLFAAEGKGEIWFLKANLNSLFSFKISCQGDCWLSFLVTI